MTKTKSTKRALLMSALAIATCFVMLVGSTFAWFTDSVTSAGNKIKAGNLDVELHMFNGTDYVDISNNVNPIFGDEDSLSAQNVNADTLWEPGKTQVAYLKIKNSGSLALKYTVALDVTNVSKDLYKVMKYDIVENATNAAPVTAWNGGNSVVEGVQSVSGDVSLAAGGEHYFALAIHMDESAGNEYQNGQVNFDLTILATQDTAEKDSFNNQYDVFADYDGEISNEASLVAAFSNGGTYKIVNDIVLSSYATVLEGKTVELDLNGKTVSATSGNVIRNKGNLTIANGTLSGTTTYTINNESKTGVVKAVNVNSVNGGFFNAGSMEVENCTVANTASGKHALVNSGNAATNLVVNGGTYSTTSGNEILKCYTGSFVVNSGDFTQIGSSYMLGGAITINGGNFTDNDGWWSRGGDSIVITGGTFNFNPTAYVADGYEAKDNGDGTYTVKKQDIVYNSTVMGDLYTFLPTLQSGDVLILPAKTYITTGTFRVPAGVTIKGEEGAEVIIRQNSSAQDNIFDCEGDVVIENISFETNRKGYAINGVDHASNFDITVINCKFKGLAADRNWGVYKNLNGNLTVKDCTFDTYNNAICGVTNGSDSTTVITGCTFTNITGEAIGYTTADVPADFEATVIANNTGLTAENVIGYTLN